MKHEFMKVMGVLGSCIFLTASVNAAASAGDIWEYTNSKEDGFIVFEFKEMNLKLPGSWEGKFQLKEEGDSIVFYHKESLELGTLDGEVGCGALFWLNRCDDYSFVDTEPSYYLVGSGENGVYYITLPGDLHGYQKNEEVLKEWMEMSDDVMEIRQEADSGNPGAPVLTKTALNLRSKNAIDGKILDVIPPKTVIWITGNLETGWVQADYNGKSGYVKADYLKFPDDISSYLAQKSDDDTQKMEDSIVMYTVEAKSVIVSLASDGNWYDENGVYCGTDKEIRDARIKGDTVVNENGERYFWTVPTPENPDFEYEGDDSAILYDRDGNSVLIEMASDGYWYDENGVCFGFWTYIKNTNMTGIPIVNENGKSYYWTIPNEEDFGSDDSFPEMDSAILYDSNGNDVYVEKGNDGNWYDKNGVCFGDWNSIRDAAMAGEPIINENGEIYYWVLP